MNVIRYVRRDVKGILWSRTQLSPVPIKRGGGTRAKHNSAMQRAALLDTLCHYHDINVLTYLCGFQSHFFNRKINWVFDKRQNFGAPELETNHKIILPNSRTTKVQNCRIPELRNFKTPKLENFRASKLQNSQTEELENFITPTRENSKT